MISRALKKKLKKLEIQDQGELISLMIAIVSAHVRVPCKTLADMLESQIPDLSLSLKTFEEDVVQAISEFDLTVFVSEADNYLHDIKRTQTGSLYDKDFIV